MNEKAVKKILNILRKNTTEDSIHNAYILFYPLAYGQYKFEFPRQFYVSPKSVESIIEKVNEGCSDDSLRKLILDCLETDNPIINAFFNVIKCWCCYDNVTLRSRICFFYYHYSIVTYGEVRNVEPSDSTVNSIKELLESVYDGGNINASVVSEIYSKLIECFSRDNEEKNCEKGSSKKLV